MTYEAVLKCKCGHETRFRINSSSARVVGYGRVCNCEACGQYLGMLVLGNGEEEDVQLHTGDGETALGN